MASANPRDGRFEWRVVGKVMVALGLVAALPALEPISSEYARQAGDRNAAARLAREAADAEALYRCPSTEFGLPLKGQPTVVSPSLDWEITFVPALGGFATLLELDGSNWRAREYEYTGTFSWDATVGAVVRDRQGILPDQAATSLGNLLDSAVRTSGADRDNPRGFDGLNLRIRSGDGDCVQISHPVEGTRGDRIWHLFWGLTRHSLDWKETGSEGITAQEARRFAREARLLTR